MTRSTLDRYRLYGGWFLSSSATSASRLRLRIISSIQKVFYNSQSNPLRTLSSQIGATADIRHSSSTSCRRSRPHHFSLAIPRTTGRRCNMEYHEIEPGIPRRSFDQPPSSRHSYSPSPSTRPAPRPAKSTIHRPLDHSNAVVLFFPSPPGPHARSEQASFVPVIIAPSGSSPSHRAHIWCGGSD